MAKRIDINHVIEDDLNTINEYMDNTDASIEDLENKYKNLDDRVDEIITTPVEGVSAQEIIDARQGRPTLRANIEEIRNEIDSPKYSSEVSSYADIISVPENVENGQVSVTVGGQTWTNLIDGAEVAPDGSRTFDSVDGHIYFDLYNGVTIAGDGTEKTVINTGDEPANMAVFDLTQIYGQGNEPTAEQAQARLHYINGTKSTISAMRLKSVGKNLFSDSEFNPSYWTKIGDGEFCNKIVLPFSSSYVVWMKGKFKANTVYTIKYSIKAPTDKNPRIKVFYTDGTSSEAYVGSTGEYKTQTLVTENGKTVDYIGGTYSDSCDPGTLFIKDIQVEEGSVATPYEPYTESTQYISVKDEQGKIIDLRSLPNGTKDEIRVSEGKLIKRVSDVYTIKSNDIDGILTRTNYVQALMPFSKLPLMPISGVDAIQGTFEINGWNEIIFTASGDYVPNVFATRSINVLVFNLPMGTTLEQARTALSGLTLTYQLAEPIEIPIKTDGDVVAYPNGTIYFERIIPERKQIYTDKMSTTQPNYPIEEIDKIYKVDKETGIKTPLEVSDADISPDRLSFTHPDLQEGDMVDWDYYYPAELTTAGEKTMIFPTNLKAQVNDNVKAIKKAQEYIKDLDEFTVAMLLNHELRISLLEVM